MPLETVRITVMDTEVVPNEVDDVVVRVFDATGTSLITQGTTGAVVDGEVEFTLDGTAAPTPTQYQLRFFVNGGAIQSPQAIEVYSPAAGAPTGTNNFEIEAAMFMLPEAMNPRLCRASGYVWGPNGVPLANIRIDFIPCFRPLVVDGYGVLGERVSVKTDAQGYVSVDLLRSGIYQVTISSHENVVRAVHVPNRSSINIFHLMFPIVVSATYTPAGPFAVTVGNELEVSVAVQANDYRVLAAQGDADVEYSTEDESIATVSAVGDGIVIHGVNPGTTNLIVKRRDLSIVYIPEPSIAGGSVAITVT